jgi:nucleoside-diphosphate-sugar epimerase
VLVNGGDGLCNAVYVDDVVQALLRAAVATDGAGERFLVSGPAPVSWREFYAAYEDMLGYRSTVSLTVEELDRLRASNSKGGRTSAQLASILRDPAVFGRIARLPIVESVKSQVPRSVVEAGKSVLLGGRKQPRARGPKPKPEKPIHIPAVLDASFQAGKTRVRTDKAEQLLRYQPVWSFRDGIARTREWVIWANLLA